MNAPLVRRNFSLALSLAAMAAGMLLLAYASVPLYRLFCQVTGFGGTTQEAKAVPQHILERAVKVRFSATVAPDLPWDFAPGALETEVKVGENRLVHYVARNRAGHATTGHATYNVVPERAGIYFSKLECFCFRDQTLLPGQEAHMPVSFFIDPAIADDPGMADIKTITLSYTFFPATSESVPR